MNLANASIKKRPQATWLETDLDLMITLEHGINIDADEQTNSKNNLYKNINNTSTNIGSSMYDEGKNPEEDEDSNSETNAFGERFSYEYYVLYNIIISNKGQLLC